MAVHEGVLDEKLATLEKARAWSPRAVSKIENLVRTGDDDSLFRANPLRFSQERGVPEPEAVDLFLHAAHAGLFDMNWHLLCPNCSQTVESFGDLKSLHSRYHCDL